VLKPKKRKELQQLEWPKLNHSSTFFSLMPNRINAWVDKKSEKWFGTPEKKMRLLQYGVYMSNIYAFFGVLFLIWVLFHEQITELWLNLTR